MNTCRARGATKKTKNGRLLSLQAKFAFRLKRCLRVSPSKVHASLQAKFVRLSKQSSCVSSSEVRASLQAKFTRLSKRSPWVSCGNTQEELFTHSVIRNHYKSQTPQNLRSIPIVALRRLGEGGARRQSGLDRNICVLCDTSRRSRRTSDFVPRYRLDGVDLLVMRPAVDDTRPVNGNACRGKPPPHRTRPFVAIGPTAFDLE